MSVQFGRQRKEILQLALQILGFAVLVRRIERIHRRAVVGAKRRDEVNELLLEGGVFGCVVDGVREGVAAGVAAGRVPLNVPGARPTVCTVPRISLPVIVPVKVASVV